MDRSTAPDSPLASASYAALRYEGVPPRQIRTQLGLRPGIGRALERLFLARPGGGLDPMRPAFARHGEHVAAVLAAGGFPVLRRP